MKKNLTIPVFFAIISLLSNKSFSQTALHFNGSPEHVVVVDGSSFNFESGDLTIEAWIRTTETDLEVVTGKEGTSGKKFTYWLGLDGGTVSFRIKTICIWIM